MPPPDNVEALTLQPGQNRSHHDVVQRDGDDSEAFEQVGGRGQGRERYRDRPGAGNTAGENRLKQTEKGVEACRLRQNPNFYFH